MRFLGSAVLWLGLVLAATVAAQPAPSPPSVAAAPPKTAPRPGTPPAEAPAPAVPPRPGARLAPGQPMPPAELEAFVDGVVRQAMAEQHIAGATVSVVQGGQIVLSRGYGFASFAPVRRVDPNRTLFRIASISKTFTFIETLKQIEAGRMSLDGDINRYLPPELMVREQGKTQPIRIRHIMNHTPGFEERILADGFEPDFDRVRPLRQFLRESRPDRVREPGVLPSYSNYAVALLGAALAQTTGTEFETLMERDLLTPAGLARTTYREPHPPTEGFAAPMPPALAADVTTVFRWTGTGFAAQGFEYVGHTAPAGAVSTTAADMGRYMQLILGGGLIDGVQVYGPLTARALANSLPPPTPGVAPWRHGFATLRAPGGFDAFGHSGSLVYSRSNMILVPELGLGVFVAVNTPGGARLAGALPALVVEHFYAGPPAPPRPGSPALSASRRAFDGAFQSTRRAHGGLEGLVLGISRVAEARVTADGKLTFLGARWVPVGDPMDGRFIRDEGEARLAFRIENGRAIAAFPPGGDIAMERVGFWQLPGTLLNICVLAVLASLATLIGLAFRNRRDSRETPMQARASLLQTSQAGLWLLAVVLFLVFVSGAADEARVLYTFPGPMLVLASTCALVAAVLGLLTLGLLPVIWRGGRRVDSWTPWRKLRFTMTALIFALFSVMLFFWGALEPWSS